MRELVSVIIPFYNDDLYVEKAVKSIQSQTYKNIEIIIIDDGSNQKAKTVLEQFNQENTQILTQKNSGPSAARNKGIRKAKGDYILTLDADDFFEPTFVEKAILILINNPKIGMVTCWSKNFNSKGITSRLKPLGDKVTSYFLNEPFLLASLLFRKQCWLDVDGYDELMREGYEDWEYNISISKKGWKSHVIEEFLFNYREKENSRNFLAKNKNDVQLKKYIFSKHKDICVKDFDVFLEYTYTQIEQLKKSNVALRNSYNYKIGKTLLSPFRKIINTIKS